MLGIPTYILINATGLETPGRFRTLRLLDIAGRTLSVRILPKYVFFQNIKQYYSTSIDHRRYQFSVL